MTKFFNKFKKNCLWPIFPIFWAKYFFLKNLAQSRTTSYGFLTPCQNLEKTNDTISRKRLAIRKDGRRDGRTKGQMDRPYFIGPFRLLPGVQKGNKTNSRIHTWLSYERNLLNFFPVRFPHEYSYLPSNMFFWTVSGEIFRISSRATSSQDSFIRTLKAFLKRILKQETDLNVI